MKPGLVPGVQLEQAFRITESMCPHFNGVLLHPVCATWTAVHHMEVVGRALLEDYLEPHEEGIGASISIEHRSPALLDSVVLVRAEVESCTPRRLTTHMVSQVDERVIAIGTFVQAILPRERLAALLEKHRRTG